MDNSRLPLQYYYKCFMTRTLATESFCRLYRHWGRPTSGVCRDGHEFDAPTRWVDRVNFYSAPVGVRSIVINPSVSLSVCLSANISLEPLNRSSQAFLCRSPVAVARSPSGSVALRYVLPVL